MVQQFFLGQMDYVFFIYGLAFFLLGASALTLRADSFPRLPWGWLAAFALSHGASEWLDLAVLSIGRSPALLTVKTLLMAASFVFLLEFARRALNKPRPRIALGFGLTLLLSSLVAAAGLWGGLLWLDVAARYLLGLTGGLLSGVAIFRTMSSSRSGERPWLVGLAILTAVYALLAGAITPPADLLLAPILNYPRFLEWSGGIPVQVPRALTAVAMAVAMWLGSQLPAAKASSEQIPFHYALGLAGMLLVLVPSGWGITETLGRQSLHETQQNAIHQARSASRIINQEIERIGQTARLLAVNDAVAGLARHQGKIESPEANRVLDNVAIGATMMLSLLAIGFYIVLHGHEVYELRVGALMIQLRDQAHTDPLTRLANRGWLRENFERELMKADRHGSSLALTMFDIDHFKAINDRFGHQAGDRVLVALAERARGLMRDYDMVSRWGGEEFIVLLPDTDLNGALRLAERLRAEIASMGVPDVGKVTCSFGVAERREGESMDSLINRADAALYQAKDAGRDRVVSG
ncbi:MAG: GGDEF domain-containing protein [Thiohalocapsa sp.]